MAFNHKLIEFENWERKVLDEDYSTVPLSQECRIALLVKKTDGNRDKPVYAGLGTLIKQIALKICEYRKVWRHRDEQCDEQVIKGEIVMLLKDIGCETLYCVVAVRDRYFFFDKNAEILVTSLPECDKRLFKYVEDRLRNPSTLVNPDVKSILPLTSFICSVFLFPVVSTSMEV